MSYVAIWLQACLHWRCAYFQTLSWNDTIFLLWIGTYCISCVVQQTSGVKDLPSLVRYDDSSLAAIRHVRSIIPLVRLRPNIRSHSVFFYKKHDLLAKGFLPPTLSTSILFICFCVDLVSDYQKYLSGSRLYERINTRKFKGLDSREITSLPDFEKVIYMACHFSPRRK